MNLKKMCALIILLVSFSVQAIPPAPPAIFKKIKFLSTRTCLTEDNVDVSDFIDTEETSFVLELNDEGTAGNLNVLENGSEILSIPVTCQ